MKSLILITTLIVVFCNNIYASDVIISLEKNSIDISNSHYFIEDVIVALEEKVYIGHVGANKKKPIHFEGTIEEELKKFFSKCTSPHEQATPLIIKINTFYTYEYIYTYTYVVVVLNVDFIVKDGSHYKKMFSASITEKKQIRISRKTEMPKTIESAFNQCFVDFFEREADNKINPIHTDTIQLMGNINQNDDFEVFKVTNFEKGIYKSFYDFRDYFPDTLTHFDVKYKKKKDSIVSANIDYDTIKYNLGKILKKNEENEPWGFSDGNQIFVRWGEKYLPIQKDSNIFYLTSRPEEYGSYFTYYTTTYGAGLIPALLASSIEKTMSDVEPYFIDFSTGHFRTQETIDLLKVKADIIFYCSKYNKHEEYFDLYINEKLVCQLRNNSWCKIQLPSTAKEINVKIVTASGKQMTKILEPRLFMTDLYLIMDKKKKPPILSKALGNVKEEYLDNCKSHNRIEALY